ncbi:MAG: hypothetical protein AB4080_18935 [Trichodesmium sp.]
MLAFIGGLFAGIFGIFPFGKKSEYLLEFDDAKGDSAPKQESTQATVTAPAPTTTTETKPASSETPKEAKAKLAAAKKAQAEEPTAPKVVAPQPTVTNVQVAEKPEELVLFAPNFLMPKPTTRRRLAGANMAMFLGIAKGMNLPR